MRASTSFAIAASLAGLAIALPLAYQHLRQPVPMRISAEEKTGLGGHDSKVKTGLDSVKDGPASSPVIALRQEAQSGEQTRRDQSVTAPAATPPVPPAQNGSATIHGTVPGKPTLTLPSRSTAPPTEAPASGYVTPNDGARSKSHLLGGDAATPADGRVAGVIDNRPIVDLSAPPLITQNRDKFEETAQNPVKLTTVEPVSTFSVDVDTASYSFVRRALNAGQRPNINAVRVEEMINYFSYDYPKPESAGVPFNPTITVTPAPWNQQNRLVHIALKGYALNAAERPRANLVFLIDTSGSMWPADRLPLLKTSFKMLLDNLQPTDTVGIVTYAGQSQVSLRPTKVADREKIADAIDKLVAGGSTNGIDGLQQAYKLAEANFDKGGVNRIILATDGDFNVGITDKSELKDYISRKRETGIYLSILGVGIGNHNDALMQTLAQNGNGAAAYIDTLAEARKVLIDEASSTLFPIAKDVKIQIEFNPARVAEYRLIGYESRMLRREDFNNDKVDAGDVGSGHSVTAIYEVTPVGAESRLVDDLRYGAPGAAERAPAPAANSDQRNELGFFKLRYKLPGEDTSKLISVAIPQVRADAARSSDDVRFGIAVAAFGQLLRGQPYMKGFTYDDVIALASGAKGDDAFGLRAEFINLVRMAKLAK